MVLSGDFGDYRDLAVLWARHRMAVTGPITRGEIRGA
jgi:hypothetical protein